MGQSKRTEATAQAREATRKWAQASREGSARRAFAWVKAESEAAAFAARHPSGRKPLVIAEERVDTWAKIWDVEVA